MALITNLIQYFKLDSNVAITDEIGTANGTNHSAVYNASGKINGDYDFTGTSSHYIETNYASTLAGSFSVNVWLKITDSGQFQEILGRDGAGHRFWIYIDTRGATNSFQVVFRTSGGDYNSTAVTSLSFGTWYMITIVYNQSTPKYSLYINGTLNQDVATTGTFTNSAGNFYLGSSGLNATQYFTGSIDEYALWTRAITSTEVTDLYAGGAGFQYPFAVAPVAAFSGTPLSGYANLSVTFTDASTNTPTSWSWEKNDGSGYTVFSTSQSPVESLGLGTWDIKLTATNAGGSDAEEKLDYVTASVRPITLLPMSGTKHRFNTQWKFLKNWRFKFL